jgi:prolyl oligopeptidase
VWRGGRQFFTRRGPGQEHEVLLTTSADGTEQVLIDPAALDPDGLTTLDGWFASCEGDRLAYLLSAGGSEQPLLRVMDVPSGQTIDGPIDGTASAGVAWLPGGTAFYYQRRAGQRTGGTRARRLVYLHPVGSDPGQDIPVFGQDLDPAAFYVPMVSPDGRWMRLTVDWGTRGVDIYLADLAAGGLGAPQFKVLQQGTGAISEASFGRDGRIYVLTDRDAPNRRLCAVDADRLDYEHWDTVLPEDPTAVLDGFAVLDGPQPGQRQLLALRSRHAVSELTLHDLATGELLAPVPAPGLGTVKQLTGHPDGGPFAWLSYTDDRTPPSVYRFDAGTGAATVWSPPPGHTESGRVQVSQVTYTSYDGTVVRMFILSPAGQPDRPRPAILYGYGSLGHSRTPTFNPLRLAWVQAGGVYAIANIRGGGEEGQAWHRAGVRENRQNVVDDFHAAGDYLVERGWTTRAQLGIHGGSAGGLLVGTTLTQRPGDYAAVLCSAPSLDMVRHELSGVGHLTVHEYGSARVPEELPWLLSQSPYHNVRPATAYPAVLLTIFEGDTRVDPLHARKFAAALQHATTAPPSQRPILLRREHNVGHTTRALSRSIPLWLDQLGFFAQQLGLDTTNTQHVQQPARP